MICCCYCLMGFTGKLGTEKAWNNFFDLFTAQLEKTWNNFFELFAFLGYPGSEVLERPKSEKAGDEGPLAERDKPL